ncbi:MAG TPA: hypothetical protein DC024_11545 [Clostridiales bacterium]|jgi:hypothetical protein|nr:hypothetical protein [Clostridiales bacterium]
MELKNIIIENKPREKAGATSSSRFDYQKDWSICQLLDHHNEKSDYLFVFDYQEDLMIMDSENNPEKVSFYQIKGKANKSYWTLGELIKNPSSNSNKILLSIIAKLYDSKLKAKDKTESLNFVSNIGFKIGTNSNNTLNKKEVCIIELSEKDRKLITEKLQEQLPDEEILGYEEITFLKVVELNLDDSPTYTQGKIATFLEQNFPKTKQNVPMLYQQLFNEVKRKSNYNKEIISFDDLISNKAIGKTQFQNILDVCGAAKDFDSIWNNIESILSNESVKFTQIKKLRNAWKKAEIERLEPNNAILSSIIKRIKTTIKQLDDSSNFEDKTLLECVSIVSTEYNKKPIDQKIYEQEILDALIISELYE